MWGQLFAGGLVSFLNFGIHALITGVIVEATRHIAKRTDHLHAFLRLVALLTITVICLMIAHVCEIGVWAAYYDYAAIAPEVLRAAGQKSPTDRWQPAPHDQPNDQRQHAHR